MTSETIVHVSTNLLVELAEPAARAIALGCLAAIVLGALRVKRVPLRLFAWTTVLYGAIAIALVGWMLPGVPMRVPGAATMERIVAANQRVANAVRVMDQFVWAKKDAKEVKEQGSVDSGQWTASAGTTRAMVENAGSPDATLGYARFGRQAQRKQATVELPRLHSPRLCSGQAGQVSLDPTKATTKTIGVANAAPLARSEMTTQAANGRPPAAQARAASFDHPQDKQALPQRTTQGATRSMGTISWAVVAAGIYALMALLLLGRLLLGLALSHRLARLSEEITDADALRKLRFRAFASGLENVPQMAESELVSVPATLNVFRPLILLPAHWREWDEAKLDAILAHEVSHVARCDSLTQRLSLIHRAIFWFSPLAWWLDRKLNELAEEASDEAALGAGADKNRYAEMLLGFFTDLEAASGRVWWQGVSMASDGSRAGHAEKRVERILAWGGSISMKKWLAVTLVAIAAPVIFLAAAVHPVVVYGQGAQEKPQSDSKNVILPGGPKAPALPNAPKGGVIAPAIPSVPQGGVTAITPVAPAMAPTPQGGVTGAGPVAKPELMPVPGAPAHPPIVPGPIANGPVTPSALTAPAMAPAPQGGVRTPAMPPTPNPALAPTGGVVGPVSFHPSGEKPSAPVTPGPSVASASITPMAPTVADAPMTPQAAASSDEQDAGKQVRDAQKEVKRAEAAMPKDEDAIAEAQKALSDAEDQLVQARAANQSMRDAKRAMKTAAVAMKEAQDQNTTIVNGNFNSGWGPRYVMMMKDSNDVSMSGDEEDLQHARELKKKIGSDFIWFEKDEKSYIITDADFIAKAKALFAPEEALEKQQDELGREQDALGKQQDALGEKMDGVKVKIRDITPELEEIRARLKELAATGATQEELGRLQSRLGQLQSEVGHSQSEAGAGQSEIGRQQGELGRKQGELGRRQGELGRQQGEIAKKASRELRQMFDDAIAKGTAKPE